MCEHHCQLETGLTVTVVYDYEHVWLHIKVHTCTTDVLLNVVQNSWHVHTLPAWLLQGAKAGDSKLFPMGVRGIFFRRGKVNFLIFPQREV